MQEQEIREAVAKRHQENKGKVLADEDVREHIRLEEAILAASNQISQWKSAQAELETKIIAGVSGQCSPDDLIPDNLEKPNEPVRDWSHMVTTEEYYVEVVYGAVRPDDAMLMWCDKNDQSREEGQ